MREVSLNGEWSGLGISPEGRELRFSGQVPGCVHTDLLAAGLLEDPFWRDNAEKCQWIEDWSWSYQRSFRAEACKKARLIFHGLDTYCEVYLNGLRLGSGSDMFIPYEFPVGDILREGENHLLVAFRSPTAEVKNRPKREGAFTTERLYTRRMQCTYSWDWVNRFVTCGIWRDVRLLYPNRTELDEAYISTQFLDGYGAQLRLDMSFSGERVDDWVSVEILTPDGRKAARECLRIVEERMSRTYDIPQPMLWNPAGYGDQPLYRAVITVGDRTVEYTHREVRFGIRTVRILQQTDEPGSENYRLCLALKKEPHVSGENAIWDKNEEFSGFIVVVNGVPVMCKGANWVPSDPFPGGDRVEKIGELLRLAVDAGVNMLRVWGGGVFERDYFYEECDRLGILVTQDFLMACGNYPDDEEWFREALAEEAKCAALRLRNHPCLAWWSGDNENAVAADDNDSAYPGRRTVRCAIGPVLRQYDPERTFLPSSPYNGMPYGSVTRGTTHNTQFIGEMFSYIRFQDMENYRAYFDKYLSRFVAEEPTMGAPMLASLRRFMTDGDIFGKNLAMWRYHTKNNPAEAFREFQLFDYLLAAAEKILGSFQNGEDRLFKLQYVQYEWVRMTMELYRRNKWFSSGIIYWMLNDCWPASGWSLIDYYVLPKAAYYAFKRSAKGLIASLAKKDGQYIVYICNDTLSEACGRGTLRLLDFEGDTREWQFDYHTKANNSAEVYRLDEAQIDGKLLGNAILLCDIEKDRTFFTEKSFASLRLPDSSVSAKRLDDGRIALTADGYVHAVILDGDYVFDDNGFSMLSGERKEISCRRAYENGSDRIEVSWLGKWNEK